MMNKSRQQYDNKQTLQITPYFSINQQKLSPIGQTTPLQQIVDTLVRRGRRHGYFLLDEQAKIFQAELQYILENQFASLQIAAMQRLTQGVIPDIKSATDAIVVLNLGAFKHIDLNKAVPAIEHAVYILTIAQHIFLEDAPTGQTVIMGCDTKAINDSVIPEGIDRAGYIQSLQLLVAGQMQVTSSMIARQIGTFATYLEYENAHSIYLQEQRKEISKFTVSVLSEELLDNLTRIWDQAIEQDKRYGTRVQASLLFELPVKHIVKPDQLLRQNIAPPVPGISFKPEQVTETSLGSNVANSRAYNLVCLGGDINFVVTVSTQGQVSGLLIMLSGFESTQTQLIQNSAAAITVGLQQAVPIEHFVRALVLHPEESFNNLGVAAITTVSDIMPYIMWRVALDYLPAAALDDLNIHDIVANQISLLQETDQENTEYPESDKVCEQCGHKIAHVGKYFMCMNCGSAAV